MDGNTALHGDSSTEKTIWSLYMVLSPLERSARAPCGNQSKSLLSHQSPLWMTIEICGIIAVMGSCKFTDKRQDLILMDIIDLALTSESKYEIRLTTVVQSSILLL